MTAQLPCYHFFLKCIYTIFKIKNIDINLPKIHITNSKQKIKRETQSHPNLRENNQNVVVLRI